VSDMHLRSHLRGFDLRSGSDSELLHHRHQIPVRPYFGDFGAFNAVDGGAGDGGLLVGGHHAEEWAGVRSTSCPVDDDLVAFGDRIVDGELHVGKTLAAGFDVMPDVLGSRGEGGEDGIVETAFVSDKFGDGVELSLAPALVHEPAYDLLVIGWLFAL